MSTLVNVSNCKNCGHQIEQFNFCPKCGAKKITKRITFKNLISEFSDRFLNLDNSLLKTFIDLFTKPEEVIDGYIHGLRKRYINAFGYFAISLTVTSIYTFLTKSKMKELMVSTAMNEEQIQIQQSMFDITIQYQSIINFMLIPLLAIISRIVFWNYKKYNLTEHFVIYLYSYSHIITCVAVLILPFVLLSDNILLVSVIQFTIYIIYIAYVLKRIYNLSFKSIILKTLLFFGIGGIGYFILTIIIVIMLLLTGQLDLEMFKPKQ